jgi:hypothetical protein
VAVSTASFKEVAFAENVYEFHDGQVYLISDGQDTSTHDEASQVHLLTTDLSGRDTFFETTDQLVGQDTDSNKDVYDARIDGGFPAPVQSVSCSADACQGPLSPAPVLLSPGSEFQAGGNPSYAPPKAVRTTSKGKKAKAKAKKKVKAKKKSRASKSSRSRRMRNGLGSHGKGGRS